MEKNIQETENLNLQKVLELFEEFIQKSQTEFPGLIRRETTLDEFSKQLYELVTDEFKGLVHMEESYIIKINLVTGECFQIKISQ